MSNSALVQLISRRVVDSVNGNRTEFVSKVIEEAISSGLLQPGAMLPPERNLCEIFDVSRTTLRRALSYLVYAGIIDRKSGKGTFVAEHIPQPKPLLMGFSQDIAARGMVPSTKVLHISRLPVSADDSFDLGVSPGTPVMRLERLRYADGQAVSIESCVVPVDCVQPDYDGTTSLYASMESKGCRPAKVVQRYGAVAATAEQAGHLGVSLGFPLLLVLRLAFSADGHPVEFNRALIHRPLSRGDRFFLSTEMIGE